MEKIVREEFLECQVPQPLLLLRLCFVSVRPLVPTTSTTTMCGSCVFELPVGRSVAPSFFS